MCFDPDHSQAFKIWTGTLIFVISFSFIFDLRDAVIYIAHFAAA